jgi:glycosyltransferase involved in cell wall biosynthesis
LVEVEEKEALAVVGAKPSIVVGIPAFNEENTIAKTVLASREHADQVVVCDDGSTDMTAKIAENLGAIVIRHEQNLGYGAAIQSLFKYARKADVDILVTLDADGQHDPDEIPTIVKPIVNGSADLVIGSRLVNEEFARTMPWYRRAGVKLITKLANGNMRLQKVKDGQSGFRAYSRRSFRSLSVLEDGMGASVEILMNAEKQGLRVCEVPSSCSYKNGAETSTHNPVSHLAEVVGSIAKLVIEKRPLLILGTPGIIFLIAGALFGVWMLQLYAVNHLIETNIALASIGSIMIGFFCLSTAITLYAISRLERKTSNRGAS